MERIEFKDDVPPNLVLVEIQVDGN